MAEKLRRRIRIGDRFGKLVVLELGSRVGKTTEYFDLCRCDCGSVVRVRRGSMQTRNTRSCGCLGESWKHGGFSSWLTRHGRARTKFYIWWNSRHRTESTLCPEWRKDFATMLEDVGGDRIGEEGLHLIRPDRFMPYGPGNFEWV